MRTLAAGLICLLSVAAIGAAIEPTTESATIVKQPLTAIRSGDLWADDHGEHINAHGGGILFHEGMYYWFGEHKIEGTAGNKAQVGVHVYASKDLMNWEDRGIALRVAEEKGQDISKGCILERPKVLFNAKTGKFVMWFHLERSGKGYSDARSGVAVSDTVTGPYRYVESFRPNAGAWASNFPETDRKALSEAEREELAKVKMSGGPPEGVVFPADLVYRRDFEGGQMARDMTLFMDDDGTAYQIYSAEENGTLHVSKLTDDYLKPAGEYTRVFPGGFNEAPAICKHEGKYFLFSSGTTGWRPNPARCCVAEHVFGPYTKLGNPCRGTEAEIGTTFGGQSNYILPVEGKSGELIFMADRWRPKNAIDGRYVWLPMEWEEGKPVLRWRDGWDLSAFGK